MIRGIELVNTQDRPTLRERYEAMQSALTRALRRWHPDVTDDPRAEAMTRWILRRKERLEELYKELREGDE